MKPGVRDAGATVGMPHPFVGLSLAAMVGIVAADYVAVWALPLLLLGIVGALIALRWTSTPFVFGLVGGTFFILHSFNVRNTAGQQLAQFVGEQTRPADVTGTVTTEPKIEANGIAAFLLRCHEINLSGNAFRTRATVLVHWRGRPQIGDELELFGTIQPVAGPRNPGEFDMRNYLARRDVTRMLIVRYRENVRVISTGRSWSVLRMAARSREWMQRVLSRDVENSPDVTGLICGTALGLRHQTHDDIEEPFQQTGTLHLFAVAGLHVGIVARLLWTVAMVLRLPRKTATALIIPLLFFYAAITGLHTASVRAAVMSALLLAGIFFDRKVLALNSLAAAAFLILLWDTNELFTTGFQLSFSVVAAIVLLADPFYRWFRQISEPDPFLPRNLLSRGQRFVTSLANGFVRGAAVSAAAWIGSFPLIYWYFHLITPVSLFANLAVVPIAYFVLALALLSLVCAPLSTALSVIFNNANWLMSRAVLALVHLFAAVPAGHVYLPRFIERPPKILLTILDEGTGAAAHVRANGYDWLLDCGPQRNYERTLKALLHSRGINAVEGILLSHGDAQHIGAAAEAILDFKPRELYDNPLTVRSGVQRRLLAELRESRSPPRHLTRGDTLLFGRDVHAEVLYPPPNLKVASADDGPMIVRVAFGDKAAALFESDAGAEAEHALVKAKDDLRSDILVKGQHHGGGSGTPDFIEAVAPKLIIATSRDIPAAEKIPDEWASDIARRGIRLFRQDESGAVEIKVGEREWDARAYVTGATFRSTVR